MTGRPTLRTKTLAELAGGPLTVMQLVERIGVHRQSIYDSLKRSADLGLVHVSGWIGLAPVWAAGSGAPARQKTCRGGILDALAAKPQTLLQLAAVTGYSLGAVTREVALLREMNAIHLADWVRHGGTRGPAQRVFALGPGEDAPKPRRTNQAQRCKDYRARKRHPGAPTIASLLGI